MGLKKKKTSDFDLNGPFFVFLPANSSAACTIHAQILIAVIREANNFQKKGFLKNIRVWPQ